MSHHTTPDTVEAADPLPAAPDGELTPEQVAALIARAKDVIAGRVPPPIPPVPAWVEEFFRKEFAGYDPPPTPAAFRFQVDRPTLVHHYQGTPVACFMVDERSAVLAVGEKEIIALLEHLPDELRADVVITDTVDNIFPVW